MFVAVGDFIGVGVLVEPLHLLLGQAPIEAFVGAPKVAPADFIVERTYRVSGFKYWYVHDKNTIGRFRISQSN